MGLLDKEFFNPKRNEDMVKDAIVAVDTNVLLSGYQWKEVTFTEMVSVLKKLLDENRLKISHHAIKEFFKNRPSILLRTLQDLNDFKSQIKFANKPLSQVAPILQNNSDFKTLLSLEQETKSKIHDFTKELEKAKSKLIDLFESDYVLNEFKNIFERAYYCPTGFDEEKLIKAFEDRCKKKIPPGYKDAGKSENSHGDYVIWDSILSLGKAGNDVLFVSCETKPDWVYCDSNGRVIGTRRELIEEFYQETKGKSFRLITPNEFMTLFKPDISVEIKEDLKTTFIDEWYEIVQPTKEEYGEILRDLNIYKNITEKYTRDVNLENLANTITAKYLENNSKHFCPRCGKDSEWSGIICLNCGYKDEGD